MGFDVVVMAASQGGLRACRSIVEVLPADFPVPVVYAQHRAPDAGTAVVDLLSRWSALEVRGGVDGSELAPRTLTVAPAGAHLGVSDERRLTVGAVNPANEQADELFTSAAGVYGARALAVVLTGRLSDGTRGVQAIKAAGGRVIVQDPETAEQRSMPWNALATGCVDLVLDPARIGDALVALVTVPGAADLFDVRRGSWAASPSGL